MKKLLFVSTLALFSCGKVEKKIQGTWVMKEIKLHDQNDWFQVPSSESPVVITKDSIGNPWASKYEMQGKDKIILLKNNEVLKVDIKKDNMMFSSYGDTMKLVRL